MTIGYNDPQCLARVEISKSSEDDENCSPNDYAEENERQTLLDRESELIPN